ncbi:L10-interacting MYB domain-containing protein-like isoform X4 [Senna tora]|uniref:L10-interacting MYB domain-containing protein-like isoform X4 n=1 Tax=Senna tora TaxID=362788 RepID=A0A834T4M6_9FABA|nr:L10-interacting MYB domain-containing protein-like isoform X4 [Senna tora]
MAYQTHSSNGKEKVKHMMWTAEMDNCLTKILAEQVKKGNKVDNILKPVAFAAALKELNEKFSLDLTKDHIKNRLKTWRKQFGILKELLAHKGFEWDEAQKMVIADNSVWIDYIRAHPDARIFRAKIIENYDELCIIIGNDQTNASCFENVTLINVDMTVDKKDLDPITVSEIHSVGSQSKILRWTDEMDHFLGEILVDQVKKGNKVDRILQTEAYETAVSALNAKFGPCITKDHIKNHLKTWKKQYELIKELLSHAEFEWDETRKMIVANDSTWNHYIKKHPDARTFRARVFENYDQLCTIYGSRNESVQCNEPLEALSNSPVQVDSSFKDQGKHMRWTTEMDRCLSEVLVEQIKLGNKSKFDKKIKSAAYEAAVLAINERFQLDLIKDQVKNRLKTMRKQFEILKEILDQSGFEWDEKRKMVNATDSVWNEYIKINPDARLLKGRVIRNYDEMCIIVGHSDPPDNSLNGGGGANLGLTINDEVMDGQEAYYHGTNNAKDKSKYVAWTDAMDRCLTELLVKQVMMGNKLEKNFKSSAYMSAVSVLNEKFGLHLTKENIMNRMKSWRKQYGLVKEMLSHGGFEWDDRRKMVVANDSEWNEYIKKHPKARHLRSRCIENYNELGVIVGNEQASGHWSETCERHHPTLNYEEHAETPAQILAIEDEETSHDDDDDDDEESDDMQGSSEQTRARPSSSNSKQPSSKKRRASDVMLEMMSLMAVDIGRIADALTKNNESSCCLEEVFEIVQNIAEFDDDLIIEACEYLCFDEKRALMFMKLDESLRKKWLLKRLRGQSS